MQNLLSQGHDMDYIAKHYNMDLPLCAFAPLNLYSTSTIFDYHRLLSKTGWKVTHRIECPLSSERLSGNQVQKMQDKRIFGTVGRTLLIAKRS